MGPLFFANWGVIHRRFCVLLWLVASALTLLIVVHFVPASTACPSSSACASHLAASHPFNH